MAHKPQCADDPHDLSSPVSGRAGGYALGTDRLQVGCDARLVRCLLARLPWQMAGGRTTPVANRGSGLTPPVVGQLAEPGDVVARRSRYLNT
jgi:hypothetical protein